MMVRVGTGGRKVRAEVGNAMGTKPPRCMNDWTGWWGGKV